MKRLIMILFVLLVLFAFAVPGFSQGGGKVFFATPEDCIHAKPGEFSVYEPVFSDHLAEWKRLVEQGKAKLVSNGKTYCADEWSMEGNKAGYHIIRWPKGNPYFTNDSGKVADGRCGNNDRHLWEVPEEVPAAIARGTIRATKKSFDTEGRPMPTPTNEVAIFAGSDEFDLHSNENGDLVGIMVVNPGSYVVREKMEHPDAWLQVYPPENDEIRVTVKPGENVDVEFKNQQRRPPIKVTVTPTVEHKCPVCGDVDFVGTKDLDHIKLDDDMQLSLIAHFTGDNVKSVVWRDGAGNLLVEGAGILLTRKNFTKEGTYLFYIEATDDAGHVIKCTREITVKKGRKFPIPCFPREKTKFGIIVPIVSCVAIVGGVGWLIHEALETGVIKTTVAVLRPL